MVGRSEPRRRSARSATPRNDLFDADLDRTIRGLLQALGDTLPGESEGGRERGLHHPPLNLDALVELPPHQWDRLASLLVAQVAPAGHDRADGDREPWGGRIVPFPRPPAEVEAAAGL